MFKLPLFKNYTIDVRLKQFRITKGTKIKFVDFSSPEGDKLLYTLINSLDLQNPQDKKLFERIKKCF